MKLVDYDCLPGYNDIVDTMIVKSKNSVLNHLAWKIVHIMFFKYRAKL